MAMVFLCFSLDFKGKAQWWFIITCTAQWNYFCIDHTCTSRHILVPFTSSRIGVKLPIPKLLVSTIGLLNSRISNHNTPCVSYILLRCNFATFGQCFLFQSYLLFNFLSGILRILPVVTSLQAWNTSISPAYIFSEAAVKPQAQVAIHLIKSSVTDQEFCKCLSGHPCMEYNNLR